jgi:hypothetical protein
MIFLIDLQIQTITATAAIAEDGTVYIGLIANQGFLALHSNGTKNWSFPMGK